MTVRPLSWACRHWTELCLKKCVLKKYFRLDYSPIYSDIYDSLGKCPTICFSLVLKGSCKFSSPRIYVTSRQTIFIRHLNWFFLSQKILIFKSVNVHFYNFFADGCIRLEENQTCAVGNPESTWKQTKWKIYAKPWVSMLLQNAVCENTLTCAKTPPETQFDKIMADLASKRLRL